MNLVDEAKKLGFRFDGKTWAKGQGAVAAPVKTKLKKRFARFIDAPVKSEINLREHWAVKQKRKAEQHSAISHHFGREIAGRGKPKRVTFVLLTHQEQDDDNLRSAMKAYRDQIAIYASFNDREKVWHYDQRKPFKYEDRGTWILIQF